MTEATPKSDLIEDLANIEHQRWSDWQAYVHSLCTDEYPEHLDSAHTGGLVIPRERSDHWRRLIATPYANLPEHSKQSDRDQVARYWPLIVTFVADWLEQLPLDSPMAAQISDRWREEMA